jgi:hypothetical protein
MSFESTANEVVHPDAWDAKLVLDFLETPGFEAFSTWIDGELTSLEAKWRHSSSPRALRSGNVRRKRSPSKPR